MKARLVGITLALEVVADDGDTLHPLQVQPVRINAADWVKWSLDDALTQIQAQLDAENETEDPCPDP
jgi:hypothetical protein